MIENTYENHRYKIKEHIVREGKSKIFTDWKELVPTLTEDEFLENLKWVCEDPCENGDGTGRLTREIGLTEKGIVHLKRINGEITVFRYENGLVWSGDWFTVPCTEKYVKNAENALKMGYADENGTVKLNYEISLSARDHV